MQGTPRVARRICSAVTEYRSALLWRNGSAKRAIIPNARRIAADIDVRVRQLEKQGIHDSDMAGHMIGYISELRWLWAHTCAADVADLCLHHPGFLRYASLMEDISAQRQARRAATCRAVSARHLAELKRGWLDALHDPPDEVGAQSI